MNCDVSFHGVKALTISRPECFDGSPNCPPFQTVTLSVIGQDGRGAAVKLFTRVAGPLPITHECDVQPSSVSRPAPSSPATMHQRTLGQLAKDCGRIVDEVAASVDDRYGDTVTLSEVYGVLYSCHVQLTALAALRERNRVQPCETSRSE